MTSPSTARHPEIDLLRTLAIAMMVVYHAAYDLVVFRGWELSLEQGAWKLLARATLTLFLLLVGASFAISWDRSQKKYGKYFTRAMWILAAGMLVSLATAMVDQETYVRFGVLHMIALSTLLLPVFAKLKEWNLLTGFLAILLGQWTTTLNAHTPLVLPLGVTPPTFASVDYVPLLPWFGIVLIGFATGYFLYVRHEDSRPWFVRAHHKFQGALSNAGIPPAMTWPGRHALLIYLLHQPIVLGVILFCSSR